MISLLSSPPYTHLNPLRFPLVSLGSAHFDVPLHLRLQRGHLIWDVAVWHREAWMMKMLDLYTEDAMEEKIFLVINQKLNV